MPLHKNPKREIYIYIHSRASVCTPAHTCTDTTHMYMYTHMFNIRIENAEKLAGRDNEKQENKENTLKFSV